MSTPHPWEGRSVYLYTRDDPEGVKVRIIRFIGEYVEVEDGSKKPRLYPQENISYFTGVENHPLVLVGAAARGC